jgi:hypothetical protein
METRGVAWGWSGDEEAQQRFGIEIFEKSSARATMNRPTIRDALEAALPRQHRTHRSP